MTESADEMPAGSAAVADAVESARRGVITHLTVGGERVAAIVPESMIEALRAAEDAEDAAEADAAMDEPGASVSWEQVKTELGV
ncbi:MAG: prevent-host-death protein [Actinobacteria bacterium]|nr:prevent-host-death protein [Actinomycetota bacterium]MBI3686407.1 prevent-host-death protein [Actinomycetota bacterium]